MGAGAAGRDLRAGGRARGGDASRPKFGGATKHEPGEAVKQSRGGGGR